MYMLVCQSCNSADIEKFDNKNMFWCHNCGEEWHKSELKIITFDEYFDVDDNTKCIDLNSENIKKMKNRLEKLYCPNEFDVYVGCKSKCDLKCMKKCWRRVFERYDLLVSEEPIYKFYCCGLHFAFKKKKEDELEKVIEAVKEDLRECLEVLKHEKITVEYIKFLGKVCTYYGYTINDLERKLIKNGKDKFRIGL